MPLLIVFALLAGVITVSAAQDFTAGKLAVALAYSIGSALTLYLLIRGGRGLTGRLAAYRGYVQIAMGIVMVGVAALMVNDLDLRFERAIADELPSALVSPTSRLERSSAVADDLSQLPGGHATSEGGQSEAESGGTPPDYGA